MAHDGGASRIAGLARPGEGFRASMPSAWWAQDTNSDNTISIIIDTHHLSDELCLVESMGVQLLVDGHTSPEMACRRALWNGKPSANQLFSNSGKIAFPPDLGWSWRSQAQLAHPPSKSSPGT
jgi:hypothetical protein